MALWMGYACLVGFLVWAAAALLERALQPFRIPIRGVWAAGLILTVLLSLLPWFSPPVKHGEEGGLSTVALLGLADVRARLDLTAAAVDIARLDSLLLWVWGASSFAVLALLGLSWVAIRRESGHWGRGDFGGERVWISATTGPALFGIVSPEIVVPAWARSLAAEAQRLIVRHEREHARACDPVLVLLGFVLVASMPWSGGCWLQLARLRRAVEVDCDARVVRGAGDPRAYGELLLQVARSLASDHARPSLLRMSAPSLEHRIRLLTLGAPLRKPGRLAGSALGAAATLLALLQLPPPPTPSLRTIGSRPPAPPVNAAAEAPRPAYEARPRLLNRHQAPAILSTAYPNRLRGRGVGGTVVLWTYVGAAGTVTESAVLESSGHLELDEAARAALLQFRYRPAHVDGRPTGAWTQQAITFVAPPPETYQSDGGAARLAIWRTPLRRTTLASVP